MPRSRSLEQHGCGIHAVRSGADGVRVTKLRSRIPHTPFRSHKLTRLDYSPMSAGVPLVMRMSSAYEVGKTVCGWPPAAQITSYLSSQVSTRVRIGLGW